MLDAQGNLYGTTSYGGANLSGTLFEVAASTHALLTLADFNDARGSVPDAGLVMDSRGNLFGTRSSGGANNGGSIFEYSSASQTLTTLYNFDGTSGANPTAGLVLDSRGNLFGTTTLGGVGNGGTVFELSPVLGPASLLALAQAGLAGLASVVRWRGRRPR